MPLFRLVTRGGATLNQRFTSEQCRTTSLKLDVGEVTAVLYMQQPSASQKGENKAVGAVL
jgi:hypothetical protein